MIYIVITIGTQSDGEFSDETGLLERIEFDLDSIPDQMQFFPPETDQIFIRPDWPPLGAPDFAERLRAWHLEHNGGDE